MAHLSLSLLGPPEFRLDGRLITDFHSDKVRALLIHLAVEANRAHRRESLAGLLWPDWPDSSARKNLSNALYELRRCVHDREARPPFLRISQETIQFNRDSNHTLDVAAFSAAVQARGEPEENRERHWKETVALYRGPFLEGFSLPDSVPFEDWSLLSRERLGRQAMDALHELAAHWEGQGELGRACEIAWRQVELEPWDEEGHRRVMRLLALSGRRGQALAQYEACRRALAEELGVEPGVETTQLYERIRDGRLDKKEESRAEEPAEITAHLADLAPPGVQDIPLLTTKLYAPPARPGPVPRPRLTERLNEGLSRKLALISAPAGFGKTTLISEWRSSPPASELPFAWVSLDREDNQPAHFWTYVIAALQRVQAGIGEGILPKLRSAQAPPIRSMLTALINEVAALSDDFVLVLDNYHTIENEAIHDGMAFLLERAPRQQHVVIASRTHPPLPLARLLGRAQLVELGVDDLRFTPNEATAFLNQVMGLDLSSDQVTALDARTEGWIVGLQMAALSMRRRTDRAAFITSFSGSHRRVVDYLVEEVLSRQTERVRDFLLRTSVLDRMCGPLCDAVTGQGDGQATLEWMEGANLFTIPLDDERHWYRYHHLFAEVLQGRLRREEPGLTPELHRRAVEWYAGNGLPAEAVNHALAAKDFERAADLIETGFDLELQEHRSQLVAQPAWFDALPETLVRSRPRLCIRHAWVMQHATSDREGAERRLRDAERALQARAEEAGDDARALAEVRYTLGQVAAGRVGLARGAGDAPRAVELSRQALALLPEEDVFWRSGVGLEVGMVHWRTGDVLSAEKAYREVDESGDLVEVAGFTWSWLLILRGHLRQAIQVLRQYWPQARTGGWIGR